TPIRGMEQLREDVTCSICLDILDDPVSIECGHNFCRGCLSIHWSEVSAQGCRCPECRAPCSGDRMIRDTRVKNLVEKITEHLQEEPEPVRPDRPGKGETSFLLSGILGPTQPLARDWLAQGGREWDMGPVPFRGRQP
uniref:RING-type domain-containing protein n=1 Tax=Chrysemys picta bellii TaxID=8478 RepID=A0A8C3FI46_CHRPI